MKTSLDHLPLRKQREVQRAAEILYEEIEGAAAPGSLAEKRKGRIYKIILFGSYARGGWVDEKTGKGYQSDFDILVVVSHKALTEGPRFWWAAEDRILRDSSIKTPVEVIVHTLAEVNTALKQGSYFFRDIREEGIALYEFVGAKASGNRRHELAAPEPLSPQEAYEIAQRYRDEVLPFAKDFMIGVETYTEKRLYKHAVFELHQAAEHAYRAYLLTQTLYSPPTHNIKKLRSLAEALDKRLIPAWPRGGKPYDRHFELLRRAYVEARYSEHYEITKEALDWLAERVVVLHEVVEALCGERLEELEKETD